MRHIAQGTSSLDKVLTNFVRAAWGLPMGDLVLLVRTPLLVSVDDLRVA
jgi:hypothetical protein